MNYIIKLLLLLSIITCWSCGADTERYQNKRNNVINVHEKLKVIMEDIITSQLTDLYIMDDYLLVKDYQARDKMIRLFDKNTFQYVTSTATFGEGPGEISNIGNVVMDKNGHIFYATDHNKQTIYSFNLDSVLANPDYLPQVKMKMGDIFPSSYQYINDSMIIGAMVEPIGHNDFKRIIAKMNMHTGEIYLINYEHPEVPRKRTLFAACEEKGLYVECHARDLMTICDFNGNLKCNVYGPNWGSDVPMKHYEGVAFCNDKIFALYSEANSYSRENATKFLVFDFNGNYIKTIETGYQIVDFRYDQENDRLILFLNEDFQFAYLDLKGLLD